MDKINIEKKRFYLSLWFPTFFILVIWGIKISESVLEISLANYGILPGSWVGLKGILTSPLIHGSWDHLIANSGPVFVLSLGLFYFYNKIAYRVFFLIYFITGIWVWFGAREAYHIGASGLVYGLAAFIGLSGIIRKNIQLTAVSLLVVFLYGGMVWGVLPLDPTISWEGHLSGMTAGIVLAIYYRKHGPPADYHQWRDEDDDDDDDDDENAYWKVTDFSDNENKFKYN